MTSTDGPSPTRAALDAFEQRTGANGLFLRYAAGRARGFAGRQVTTLLGAGALAAIDSLWLGLATACLGFAVDALDSAFLHVLARRWGGRVVPRSWRRAALALGALQGASISACIALAWTLSSHVDAQFFATAFAIGAALNAGLARPYCRAMADVRLWQFAVTFVGLLLWDAAQAPSVADWLHREAYYLIATLMLAYAARSFLRHIARNFDRGLRLERQLLGDQHALAEASARLAEREAQARRLALVAENANDSILICGPDGRIDWVNETFVRLMGLPREAVLGRRPGEVLDSTGTDPAVVEALIAAREGGRPWRVEVLNNTPDGRRIWVETSGTPIFDESGRMAMTIQIERDVTAARDHAAALAEASRRAAAAAEAKARFLATMSHEIRTPMNAVLGMAGLLSQSALDDDQRGCVEAIIDSGKSLLSIINDILDLSRLEAGGMQIAAAPMDAAAVVRGVARLLTPLAEAKGLRFDCIGAAGPVWVSGDEGRIRQVLTNLVGNAVRFTREGHVAVRLEAVAAPEPAGHVALAIAVEDTGVGIPPDRQEAIFDSFTQSDGSISREFGGTGLGLAIARQLARLMGGDIGLVSEPGRGSIFTLRLTLPAAEAPQSAAEERPLEILRLAGRTILIAEDNRTNRLILRRLIERTGAAAVEAVNGAEAVAAFASARPDLVFMDMQMPVMDGLSATAAIRAAEAEAAAAERCPVLMLTANAFAEDAEAAERVGCDDFLTKPVMPADIWRALARYLSPSRDGPDRPTLRPDAGPTDASGPRAAAPPADARCCGTRGAA